MERVRKYALHPGYVISQYDGERHFIGVRKLVRLYELKEGEWFRWIDNHPAYRHISDDYVHLYPRDDGNYGRPNA